MSTNVRNEGTFKRKEFLAPYRSTTDFRYEWLQNVFLKYLADWKLSTETRGEEGDFSVKERGQMFLSMSTYEGVILTVNSLIETSRFVLNHGMPSFLPEKVNQDCTEEHFGRQRRCGGTNANPTRHRIGYQENLIRNQRKVAPVTGNTRGRHTQRKVSWYNVDEQPLPKKHLVLANIKPMHIEIVKQ